MNKNISITLNITCVFSHSYAQKLFYTVEIPLEKKTQDMVIPLSNNTR